MDFDLRYRERVTVNVEKSESPHQPEHKVRVLSSTSHTFMPITNINYFLNWL